MGTNDTFHQFNSFPEELRRQIWTALPGSRIVYIQRQLTSGEDPNDWWNRRHMLPGPLVPTPTYFTSPTPTKSLMGLALTSRESNSVFKKRYLRILPTTLFDPSVDFLYLDCRGRYHTLLYHFDHFLASRPNDRLADSYGHPKFDQTLLSRIENLIVHDSRHLQFTSGEHWLANEVLKFFTGVKALVLADRFHNMYEDGEELVWLRGDLGHEMSSLSTAFDNETGVHWEQQEVEEEQQHRMTLRDLLLWRDRTQDKVCRDVPQQDLESFWKTDISTKGRDMPVIIRKSVTTARVKKCLLEICCCEDSFLELKKLNWDWVMGEEYHGNLDLSQQIAYLELVLGRLTTDLEVDSQGEAVEGDLRWDVIPLMNRRDALVAERGFLELMTSEAEERSWE